MHFKFRNMLTAGCVVVLALSLPASIEAAPKKIDKNRAQLHRADQQHKNARHVVSPREKAKLTREEHANRLVSTRIAETPKRPVPGWAARGSEARRVMRANPQRRRRALGGPTIKPVPATTTLRAGKDKLALAASKPVVDYAG